MDGWLGRPELGGRFAPAIAVDEDAVIHRTFADQVGRLWEVWEMTPSDIFRPDPDADVRAEVAECPPEGAWARGWLTFHCGTGRRRLAPVPERWERATDDELRELLERADWFQR